jgi:hypothetical protein
LSSKDSQEYILAWVGAASGVLGVVLAVLTIVHPQGFPVSAPVLGYMSVAALLGGAVGTGLLRFIRNRISRPDIETDSIVLALTINDKEGKDAVLTRTQVDRANRKVLSHTLTVGGIAATGRISEIQVDGHVVPQAEWERQVTSWRVTKTRQIVLNPGETISREFQMKLVDSFTEATETHNHDVANKMTVLTLKVKFPPDRNPRKTTTFLAFGSLTHEALQAPELDTDGFRSVSIVKPQIGGAYRIEWEW